MGDPSPLCTLHSALCILHICARPGDAAGKLLASPDALCYKQGEVIHQT
jgi:hypothetical protein